MLMLLYQDVIVVMDQCDILFAVQATKISSDCIKTEDNSINICKANTYCYQFYVKVFLFPNRYRKEHIHQIISYMPCV